MRTVFRGKKISGILGILPETVSMFDDEVNNYNFPPRQTQRLKKLMGYNQHRLSKPTTATSDFCVVGLEHILNNGWLKKEEIGGLVVPVAWPDHFIPPVSSIIHGKFGLPAEVMCIDISQGCAGFIVGLSQAFMMLEHMPDKKIVVFTSNVLSHKVSKQDRNSYPLVGDGAGIAILENAPDAPDIHCIIRNRGDLDGVLTIPAGGSRLPCSPETAIMRKDEDGNIRCLDNSVMKGAEVFNFANEVVPPVIEDVLEFAGQSKNDTDLFLLHQPNKFMVRKIVDKLGVPYEKAPMNIVENFGNSGGACIPISITFNFAEQMRKELFKCVLCAFGSGLAWGAMTMKLGQLDFCELLETNL